MGQYFKNLMIALAGRNPYQLELDKVKEEMKKADENVTNLQESYYKAQEKKAEVDAVLEDYSKKLISCQNLVENLREHLTEKEKMIEQMRKEAKRQLDNYEKRIKDYSVTISKLQENNRSLKKAVEGASEKIGELVGKKDEKPRRAARKPRRKSQAKEEKA